MQGHDPHSADVTCSCHAKNVGLKFAPEQDVEYYTVGNNRST